MSTPLQFGEPEVVSARIALAQLHSDVGQFINTSGILPAAESPVLREQEAFPAPELVKTAYSQSMLLLEIGGDQLTALVKMFTDPVETIAPWASVRALLEASALASWLLDENIDAFTRVERSLGLRFEELTEQRKCLRSANSPDADKVLRRIADLISRAELLGYSPIVDRKGRKIGAGIKMPPMTELIRSVLDEEVMYRLLSAVAHAHFWAIHQLSFQRVSPGPAGFQAMQKSPNPTGMMYLSLGALRAFSRAVWKMCLYCGWDRRLLDAVLTRAFDAIGATPHVRFWRDVTDR
jgi:hypothetical protein